MGLAEVFPVVTYACDFGELLDQFVLKHVIVRFSSA